MATAGTNSTQKAAASATGVLASATTGAGRFISSNGGDADSIFGRSGIDPENVGPTTNISLKSYCTLFETAAAVTGNDNIGLWFGQQFGPTDLGLIGYVAIHSQTLGDGLKNFVELFPYHQQETEMSLTGHKDLLSLNYRITDGNIIDRRQDAELSLGMFCNIFRHGFGAGWSPEEVHFEHPKPANWQQHEQAFQAPVFFNQRANSLVFRPEQTKTPMPMADPRLLMILRKCLRQVGIQEDGPRTVPGRIKDYLVMTLSDGCPTLEQTADALAIPAWTIQRRLEEAGLTFSEVVETTRRELAQSYLKQQHIPLTEIAFLLGYSELSAFSRAFTRWMGRSPRQYRGSLNS